jgi:hypothetical protein
MKYDPIRRKKLSIAIRHDSALRVSGECSLVSARKTGLPPSGFTIGKSALRNRSTVLIASAIV